MRLASLVAAAALVLPTALAGTCPNNPLAHCYPSTCQGQTSVDFVFVIDMSASMSDYIQRTVNALTSFVTKIDASGSYDAKYGIYTFGIADSLPSKSAQPNPQPAQYTTGQAGSAVQKSLQGLVSQTGGSIENGLVAITMAANNYAWRSGSLKTIFLLTNEDSDPDFALKSSDFNAYYYPTTYNALPTAHPWSDWQAEIDSAANAVIAKNISLYMSVLTYNDLGSNGGLLTPLQYGEPGSQVQSQNSDFTNFNAGTTLNNIKARYFSKSCSQNCVSTSSSGVSIANSLQAQVLASQIKGNAHTARVFDLSQVTSNSNFFNNIFQAIQTSIDVCSACYSYTCASDNSCATPKYICDCAGTPNGKATIDCAGVCGGSSQIDVCTNKCSANANLNVAKCSCPSLTYDPCGNCKDAVGWNTTATQFCIQDCKGKWVNATDLNTFNDDCGVKCGNNGAKDLCGVCFGNNTKTIYANDGPCACFTTPYTCPGSGYTICTIPDSARLPNGTVNGTALNCPSTSGCDLTQNNFVCGTCTPKATANSSIYDNCGYCKNLNATCVQDCKGVYGGGAKVDNCGNCQEPGVVDPTCVLDCNGNYTTNVTVSLDCNYKCVALSQVSKANCTVIYVPPVTTPPNNTPAIVGGVVGGLAAVGVISGLLFYLHRSGVLGAASKQVDMGASSQNPLYSSATQVQSNPLYAS